MSGANLSIPCCELTVVWAGFELHHETKRNNGVTVEQGSGETALPGRDKQWRCVHSTSNLSNPAGTPQLQETGRRANGNLLHPPRQIAAKPGRCRPTAYRYVNVKQILQEKTGMILASSVRTPVTFPASFAAYRIDSSL